MNDDRAILDDITSRRASAGQGISTAYAYLSGLEGCFDGGFCPTKLLGETTPNQWSAAIKQSKRRLVYRDDGMRLREKAPHSDDAPEGTAMVFEAVITTTRRDRDGDRLESRGAQPDESMPLLWQHVPFEPIGKLLSIVKHNTKQVAGRFAIIDNPLGRDAARLVEFGALRISHGFRPLQFEPLDEADAGWHVRRFEIVETSLVSVPSNVDAVVTAFSRGKLHHPLVKGWAAGIERRRPRAVRVGADDLNEVPLTQVLSEKAATVTSGPQPNLQHDALALASQISRAGIVDDETYQALKYLRECTHNAVERSRGEAAEA